MIFDDVFAFFDLVIGEMDNSDTDIVVCLLGILDDFFSRRWRSRPSPLGDGNAAKACIAMRKSYIGVCCSDAHVNLLRTELVQFVLGLFKRETSMHFQPNFKVKPADGDESENEDEEMDEDDKEKKPKNTKRNRPKGKPKAKGKAKAKAKAKNKTKPAKKKLKRSKAEDAEDEEEEPQEDDEDLEEEDEDEEDDESGASM